MAATYSYSREAAVRVKVKKCELHAAPEWRKFSVDPQITSLEVLCSILVKAFDIKSDFEISYKAIDPIGQEVYLRVISDWDLDAAFLRAHNISIQSGLEPCLNLRIDIKAFSETIDWEVNSTILKELSPLQQSIDAGQKYVQTMQNKLPGIIMNQVEKTFSMVQRALNLNDYQIPLQPPRPPLCDAEFRNFLDSVGQILRPNELREVIFNGGIDPSLRRVVWKHILNVYPNGMTGRERMDYMKKKATEYNKLRDRWKLAVQKGPVVGELAYVTSMVRKDVLRTDRLHPFYAGSDDNQNIASLFNILTTYALNHPSVSYCQGMSDIASPLLVTMRDEAHAYICFCAIMTRLKPNFMLDGIIMTQKFTHLADALQYYDPEFYEYLKSQQADDLLFCYRWLLLEMKREFAFDESLRMLEVLWSSLNTEPPCKDLKLFEKEFELPLEEVSLAQSPSLKCTPRENPYTKVCALRRQSSSISILSGYNSLTHNNMFDSLKWLNQSLDENIIHKTKNPVIKKAHQSLDETKMLGLKNDLQLRKSEILQQQNTERKDETVQICFLPTNPFLDDSYNDLENSSSKTELDENLNENDNLSLKKDTKNKVQKSSKLLNKNIFSCNSNNIISKQLNNKRGGHFKDLKEKIVASKKGILASLEKLESLEENKNTSHKSTTQINSTKVSKKGQKVVKNFNEFLTFAAIDKNKIPDIENSSNTSCVKIDNDNEESTKLKLAIVNKTKNSFDESDSSTLEGSTASSLSQNQTNKPLQLHLTSIVAQSQTNLDVSSPEDNQDYYPMTTQMTRELRLELENLDRQVFGNFNLEDADKTVSSINYEKLEKDSIDLIEVLEEEIISYPNNSNNDNLVLQKRNINSYDSLKRISSCSGNTDIFVWENPLHQISGTSSSNLNKTDDDSKEIQNLDSKVINNSDDKVYIEKIPTPDEQLDLEYDGDMIIDEITMSIKPLKLIQPFKCDSKDCDDDSDSESYENNWKHNISNTNPFLQKEIFTDNLNTNTGIIDGDNSLNINSVNLLKLNKILPPPSEFGGGNSFLMFLCLTLLLQHRNLIIKNSMDYNEMAMHFDKMVRKHNVTRVLNQARAMYSEYLNTHCRQSQLKNESKKS